MPTKTSNRSSGVAKRLGLNEGLSPKPPFMSTLTYAAYRIGGKEKFMRLAKLSDDEKIKHLVSIWNKLSKSDRKYLSLDDLCKVISISPRELFLKVLSATHRKGEYAKADLLRKAMRNSVVILEANIERALKPEGLKERIKVLKAGGILPIDTKFD